MTWIVFTSLTLIYSILITKMAWTCAYKRDDVGYVLWAVIGAFAGVPIIVFLTGFIVELINKF